MKRVKVIAICLPPEVQDDGKQAAQAEGRSLSNYIAHLIRLDVQKRKQQQNA